MTAGRWLAWSREKPDDDMNVEICDDLPGALEMLLIGRRAEPYSETPVRIEFAWTEPDDARCIVIDGSQLAELLDMFAFKFDADEAERRKERAKKPAWVAWLKTSTGDGWARVGFGDAADKARSNAIESLGFDPDTQLQIVQSGKRPKR